MAYLYPQLVPCTRLWNIWLCYDVSLLTNCRCTLSKMHQHKQWVLHKYVYVTYKRMHVHDGGLDLLGWTDCVHCLSARYNVCKSDGHTGSVWTCVQCTKCIWKIFRPTRPYIIYKLTIVPFTLASKNQNLSRIRVFRWKLLGNFP